jgi:glutathione synthase/RimK-type ligase-like ATP-grasp enzyme
VDVLLATARDLPDLDQDDAPLATALRARGLTVGLAAWDDPDVDWSAAGAVVIRSTWDYTDRRDDFLAWTERVEEVTPLHNSADVVRWNTHKGYLIELEERGAPIVPTAWLGQGDRIDLGQLLDGRGWNRAIVKPAVDAGARGLLRVEPDDRAAGQAHLDALLARGDAMVQPYAGSVERDGELSVIHIDGAYSHAIRKRPPAGEFRIQVEYGGRYELETPPQETLDLAAWVLESTGHGFLYARVDLLTDDNGTPQLAELEVTEPSLYLTHAPAAAERLAGAIHGRLP